MVFKNGKPCAYSQLSGEATVEFKGVGGISTKYEADRKYTDMPANASSAWDRIAVDPKSNIIKQKPYFYIGNFSVSSDGISYDGMKKSEIKDKLVEADIPFFTFSADLNGQALLDSYNYTFVPSSRNKYLYVIPNGYKFIVPTPCPAPKKGKK